MAIFDSLLGREEDQLSKAAPGEDTNLETHVELCARRYKTLSDRIRSQNRLLWAVVILLVISETIDLSKIGILSQLF